MRPTRGKHAGQALVEFALVLPVIVVLILGALDFGRAVFLYNELSGAARQGVRTAIVNQSPSAVQTAAINDAPTAGLTASDVSACYKEPTATALNCPAGSDQCAPMRSGCLAIVTTQLNYDPLTPIVGRLIGPIVLSSTSILPIEFVCISSCS